MALPELTPKAGLRNFICVGCAAPIQGARRTKKYCQECANKARAATKRKYDIEHYRDRSVVKNKVCGRCQEGFATKRDSVRYCDTCRDNATAAGPSLHYYLKQPSAQPFSGVVRACTACGENFNVKAARHEYCSRKCGRAAYGASPAGRLNARIRAGVHKSLKVGKGGQSWTALLGYSVADLKRHLERQFLAGMGWNNMGDWHIDHRLPLVSFSFTNAEDPAFKAAWALSNLQPMWADQNIRKKAKRLYLV